MAEWVPIEDGFIAADVIRWKENVYKPRRSNKSKPFRLGERLMIAEVLQGSDRNGWVRLLVRKCETLLVLTTRQLPVYLNGAEIKRARKTIMRGTPERLLWSDESARAVVASECPAKTETSIGAGNATGARGSRSRRHKPQTTHPAGKAPVPDR